MTDTNFKLPTIWVGADPEVFLIDKKTNKNISAYGLLPGTKENPFKVDCGAVQVDGTAAEFNIDPAASAPNFLRNIQTVLLNLKILIGSDKDITIEPFVRYDKIYWDGLPSQAKELGCNPDYNAWSGAVNPPPDRKDDPTLCTGAGHIHIGWGKNFDISDTAHFVDCCLVAKQMDYALGIRSLEWDPDPTRRTLYGKAGCLRPKKYGMEYRTLSNAWLKNDNLIMWVWIEVFKAMNDLFQGIVYVDKYGDMARKIINENITNWRSLSEFKSLGSRFLPPPVKNISDSLPLSSNKKTYNKASELPPTPEM